MLSVEANRASIIVFACIYVGIIIQGCSQVENRSATQRTPDDTFVNIATTDSITVTWDPPTTDPDSIANYELGYRTSKQTSWTIIKNSIPAQDSPFVVVHRNEIDASDSIFSFAVRVVAKNGSRSDFHASTDPDAVPPDWYVLWN